MLLEGQKENSKRLCFVGEVCVPSVCVLCLSAPGLLFRDGDEVGFVFIPGELLDDVGWYISAPCEFLGESGGASDEPWELRREE